MAKWLGLAFIAAFGATGCAGGSSSLPGSASEATAIGRDAGSASPIRHVILAIQENRTFNDFFATYPGADGTTTGAVEENAACKISKNKTIALTENPLVLPWDASHEYRNYVIARDGGKMDGFDLAVFSWGQPECTYPYQYTDPSQIKPYWIIAKQYVLAEHMFSTQGSGSFTAHQDLIRGNTLISPGLALVDYPSGEPWGCDAPTGTVTSLITAGDQLEHKKGPFPCFTYQTLRDLLDAKSVSWKFYTPAVSELGGNMWNAYDAIKAVRYGPEWKTNVISPQTQIFSDISNGTLPSMSWLIPDEEDSDHPANTSDTGPSWIAGIVNAIGKSKYWDSTAIIVVWDDWGGFYDNLDPKQYSYGELGLRVPALIVSAYAKQNYISQTDYEFGSILKYIENNWNLGRLGTTDERATSIIDCFDYSQKPRRFVAIPSKYSKEYFLRRPPSGLPVDTE